MEAGHRSARAQHAASVARAIGGHLSSGSAAISATGAKLARLTRNLTGRQAAVMPDRVQAAVGRALAAEAAAANPPARSITQQPDCFRQADGFRQTGDSRQADDFWQASVGRIPAPRAATA